MPEKISSTIAWRRRLGFWDDVRWTRRQFEKQIPLRGDAGGWGVAPHSTKKSAPKNVKIKIVKTYL